MKPRPFLVRLSEADIAWLDMRAQAVGLSRNQFLVNMISEVRATTTPTGLPRARRQRTPDARAEASALSAQDFE